MDGRTIRERVRSLHQEVARIREENQRYLLKHRHTWQEQQLHGDRDYEVIIGARDADDVAVQVARQLQLQYPQVKSQVVL